jgi:DNA end-binding protein Ku
LDTLVEAKAQGVHPDDVARTATASNVVDLMSVLTASVKAAEKGHAKTDEAADERPVGRAPAKRGAAKKATAAPARRKKTG